MSPNDILSFWRAAGPKSWFAKDDGFDAACRRFAPAVEAAARGELAAWMRTLEGALALVLLLDQFPRNLYRGGARAFAADPLARQAAAAAIAAGYDQATPLPERIFFYLPFEHSEDAADQARSMALFEATGDEDFIRYARLHRDIIERFGRFPHRNAALGREDTPQETLYLAEGGFKG